MQPSTGKLLLTAHVVSSVGWTGALAVFLAHAAASLWSGGDPRVAQAMALAMAVAAWGVILPLSLASFATGIAQSLLGRWGLLRHHWVALKLALTVAATAVLLLKLGPIDALARSAVLDPLDPNAQGLQVSLTLHAAGGLAVLLAAAALAIYKPAGRTRWGARRHGDEPAATPRWAKAAWAAVACLAALSLAMVLLGAHGPGAHFSH